MPTESTTHAERIKTRIDATITRLETDDVTPDELRDLGLGLLTLEEALDKAADREGRTVIHNDVLIRWTSSVRRLLADVAGLPFEEADSSFDEMPRSYDLELKDDLLVGPVRELMFRLADAAELVRHVRTAPRSSDAPDLDPELERTLDELDHVLRGDPGHADPDEWAEHRQAALDRHRAALGLVAVAGRRIGRRAFYDVKDGVLSELENRVP